MDNPITPGEILVKEYLEPMGGEVDPMSWTGIAVL